MKTLMDVMRVAVVLVPLALGGCATMSENDCRTADWSTVGFRDGRDGHSTRKFHERAKACAQYGITPDRSAYFDARAAGLDEYCTAEHGFVVGESGGSYENVCPRATRFEEAYEQGYEIYQARADVDRVESEIAANDKKMKSRDASPEEREQARARRDELERQRDEKKRALKRLEHRWRPS